LSREQERNLLTNAVRGDREALNELVESNLGFVVKVAGEYRGLGLPFEDLINEGNLGLLEAARRFDPQRNVKFVTYAVWWVRKSILRAISDKARVVRLPYMQFRKADEVRRAEGRLRNQLGRDPDRRELARELDLSERELEKRLGTGARPLAIVRAAGDDEEQSIVDLLKSLKKSPEQRILDREALELLERSVRELTRQQQDVIALRFGLASEERMTLRAAAERIGVSRERIRQIEKQALQQLRRRIGRAFADAGSI
jgi:RNA polymerase primary sigma factor